MAKHVHCGDQGLRLKVSDETFARSHGRDYCRKWKNETKSHLLDARVKNNHTHPAHLIDNDYGNDYGFVECVLPGPCRNHPELCQETEYCCYQQAGRVFWMKLVV